MRSFRVAVLVTMCCATALAEGRLTKVNVVALDRQGQFVPGLRSADFQVQENGKNRKIVFFRFTGGTAAQPDAAGTFSNRIEVAPRGTVVLLDLLSDYAATGPTISEQLTRAVGSLGSKNFDLSQGLYLYLLTSTGQLYPVHALPKAGEATSNESWTQNLAPALAAALKKVITIKPIEDADPKLRIDLTSQALRQLGAQMQIITGRKNLIWLTRGLPTAARSISSLGDVDFSNDLRLLNESLSRAQVAVYPVGGAIDSNGYNALDEMANATGGRKYAFGSVEEALRRAAEDSRSNYQLAFYSEDDASERHKLKITSAHKDMHLQVLSGFSSALPSEGLSDVERRELATALHSPYDAIDIGLRASAMQDPVAPLNTRFDIRIDPADILMKQTPNNRTGTVLLWLAAYGTPSSSTSPAPISVDLSLSREQYSTNRTVRFDEPGHPISLEFDLSPEQYTAAATSGITLHGSAALGANVKSVRVILVDGELGAAGAVTIPVQR